VGTQVVAAAGVEPASHPEIIEESTVFRGTSGERIAWETLVTSSGVIAHFRCDSRVEEKAIAAAAY
jgi:hypothetical protein